MYYSFTVNGLESRAKVRRETVEKIFYPLLAELTKRQKEKKKRLVVFLAAPPAVGKSTLALLLEKLSRERDEFTEVQALGLDGFHFANAVLASRYAEVGGRRVLLKDVKGCPETFDTDKFREKLAALTRGDVRWPVYSRVTHDPAEDAEAVTGDIVLIEGNWLLLDEEPWRSFRKYADYAVFIRADETMLKERLIRRKTRGGLTRAEASAWYERSDGPNIRRALENSMTGDLNLALTPEGDFRVV